MKTYICRYIACGKRHKVRVPAHSFEEACTMASIIPNLGGVILSLAECPVQDT